MSVMKTRNEQIVLGTSEMTTVCLSFVQVKLSLQRNTEVKAELIFNGTESDIKDWFNKTRLISSPWEDLKSTSFLGSTGRFFSMEGHAFE